MATMKSFRSTNPLSSGSCTAALPTGVTTECSQGRQQTSPLWTSFFHRPSTDTPAVRYGGFACAQDPSIRSRLLAVEKVGLDRGVDQLPDVGA